MVDDVAEIAGGPKSIKFSLIIMLASLCNHRTATILPHLKRIKRNDFFEDNKQFHTHDRHEPSIPISYRSAMHGNSRGCSINHSA